MTKRGRRFVMFVDVDPRDPARLGWRWIAWRLFERVEGFASSEREADDAIDHFLSAPSSYSLTGRG